MTIADQGAQSTGPERSPVDPIHIVADPAPLGLGAFAMTTLALSVFNANIWSGGIFAALSLALVYGGFAQLLAGMWEFTRKNTFGAIAFTSYGAFWIAYYVFVHFLVPGMPAADAPQAVGVFLLGWTILTFYLMIASFRVSGAVAGVFVALDVTFVLLTIGAFQSNANVTKAGGWAGIVTAAIAFYASAAGVINETYKKPVLPVFPLAPRG
jgi:succinate-acetate transporter protein